MDKLVKSSFTFGLTLVVIGIIGHFIGWNKARIVILLGLVFEFFAALVFIWNKLKQK